jgi:predicted HicB family RNase H-like nuclease
MARNDNDKPVQSWVDPDTHRALRVRAAERGESTSGYVSGLIRRDVITGPVLTISGLCGVYLDLAFVADRSALAFTDPQGRRHEVTYHQAYVALTAFLEAMKGTTVAAQAPETELTALYRELQEAGHRSDTEAFERIQARIDQLKKEGSE